MKKLLTIASMAAILMFGACKKTKKIDGAAAPFTVEQKQNVAYMYFGGTWCGPCGAYGKPTKQGLHENATNANAVFISFQVKWSYSDPFATQTTDATAASFGVTGVPTAYIAGGTTFTKTGFFTSNAANISGQQTTMNGVYSQTALVNGKVTPSLAGNALTVKSQNKFFSASSDTFYVQSYVTESNLTATQNQDGSTKLNIHDFIWRAQSGSNFYGDLLVIAPTAGQVVEKNLNIVLQDIFQKGNCDVNVIIWHKKGGKFGIENCYKSKMQP